jgi:hypothetical protein
MPLDSNLYSRRGGGGEGGGTRKTTWDDSEYLLLPSWVDCPRTDNQNTSLFGSMLHFFFLAVFSPRGLGGYFVLRFMARV